MSGQWDEAFPIPVGNRYTMRYELLRQESRSAAGSGGHTCTPDSNALDRVGRVSNSYLLERCQPLPEFSQTGTDSRLHRSERLIELPCDFLIRQFRKKCQFD